MIRVAHSSQYEPLTIDNGSEIVGVLPDYYRLLGEKLSVKFEYVDIDWRDVYDKLAQKEFHLIALMDKRVGAQQNLLVGEPIFHALATVFARKDRTFDIKSLEDIATRSVAYNQNLILLSNFLSQSKHPSIVARPNSLSALQALLEGEADVMLGANIDGYYLAKHFIQELEPVYYSDELKATMGPAVRQQDKILLSILNKAVSSVTFAERQAIIEKWNVDVRQSSASSLLNQEQKTWVADNPVIPFYTTAFSPPYNYLTRQNQFVGITADILKGIEKRTGLKFEINAGDEASVTKQLRQKSLGLLGILPQTGIDESQVEYFPSESLVKGYVSLFGPTEQKGKLSLKDINNQVIATSPSFELSFAEELLSRNKRVVINKADRAIGSLLASQSNYFIQVDQIADFYLKESQVTNIDKIYTWPTAINGSFWLPKNQTILAQIIQVALEDIRQTELQSILNRWHGRIIDFDALNLSQAELDWLRSHSVIKVGNSLDYPPFDFNVNGQPQGYSVDYIKLLAEKLNLNIEFEQDTWPNLLQKLRAQELDVLVSISTSSQEAGMGIHFSEPYKYTPIALIARTENQGKIDFERLSGKTIAIGNISEDLKSALQQRFPESKYIEFSDNLDSMKAVSFGDADVTIITLPVANYIIRNNFLTNLVAVDEISQIAGANMEHRLAVKSSWPELVSILDKAKATLRQQSLNELDNKWINISRSPVTMSSEEIALSVDEKLLLGELPPLKFSGGNWKPMAVIAEDGSFSGLIADYLSVVSEKTGIEFQYVPKNSWSDVIEGYRTEKLDLLPAVESALNVGRETLFSDSYISFPMVIVTGDEVSFIRDTRQLNGRKVAVGKNYASFDYLRANYPDIELVEVEDVKEGLLKVVNSETYAFVGHLATAVNYIQELGLKNLKIVGETDFTYQHRIGISTKYDRVLPIINKALASMTTEEHRLIYDKWLPVEYDQGLDYAYISKIVGIVIFIAASVIIIISIWNRKLALEIIERKKVEEKLAEAKDRAESATKAKSTFLANMSHEIRTPMNAILGYAQLLNKDKDLSEENHYVVETINRSGEHLLGLINDMLDMSKIEAGRMEVTTIDFNLRELIDDIITMMDVNARYKDLRLEIDVDNDVPIFVRGDEGKLRQILINLIGNAIKFTDTGTVGVSISVVEKNENLHVIQFKISDTGIGISRDKLSTIFDAFSQAEGGQLVGGTGLGLPISLQLARMMHGDIQVDSEPGKGSDFYFVTRLYASGAKALVKQDRTKKVKGAALGEKIPTVLIVDDQPTNRMLLNRILKRHDFPTLQAENGKVAIEVYLKHRPPVILMDSVMPVLDGVSAIKKIREAQSEDENLTIIGVTANVLESEINALESAGANTVLKKPVQLDKLLMTISEYNGLRLVYEESTIENNEDDLDRNPNVFEELPDDIRRRIIDALKIGKIAELRQLVFVVKEWDMDKGKVFESMVKRYDLKGLKRHFL
ncbi:transporter substrate-binding domain-containing protein [Aliikangiella marina]|uniref:transporter substrate-binding domain-containing protein n=1 Tax=Aliikangiella marina TaxID=1712262 RepID=UPI00163D8FC9|nr:transporter substrate-binding domain-containing protein [Aliikangiella marina]